MNREQRRKAGIPAGKTYTLNESQIQKIKDDVVKDAMSQAFVFMMGLSLNALRDEFDWGKIRLTRFSDKVLDLLDSVNKGYISFYDCLKVIKDETGVDFIKSADERRVSII